MNAVNQQLQLDKSDWPTVCFGDVVQEVRQNSKDPAADRLERVVGLEHIDPENIHLRRWGTLEDNPTFSKTFRKGHVLFGRRRAYLKKAALAEFDGICSGDITVMEAKNDLLPELLPFLVNNDKFFDYAVQHSAGGLSPRTKFKDLAGFEFPLPPKDQQAELAKLLLSANSCEDQLVNLVDQLNYSMRTVILGESAAASTGSITFGDLGLEIIDGDRGSHYPKSTEYLSQKDGFCLFLNAKNVTKSGFSFRDIQFISKDKDTKLRKGKLFRKDIVVTTRGTVGNFAFYSSEVNFDDVRINSGMAIIRATQHCKIDPAFVYMLMKAGFVDSQIQRYAYGSAQPQLSVKILAKLEVPHFSSLEEKTMRNKIRVFESAQEASLKRLERVQFLQKSLINQIF